MKITDEWDDIIEHFNHLKFFRKYLENAFILEDQIVLIHNKYYYRYLIAYKTRFYILEYNGLTTKYEIVINTPLYIFDDIILMLNSNTRKVNDCLYNQKFFIVMKEILDCKK